MSFLKQELETLRAENKDLKSGLQKFERLRKEMERKFAEQGYKVDNKELLEKVLGMGWTRNLAVDDDERAGLILNLSHMIGDFTVLDNQLAAVNHASRNGVENPVAIVSERELGTVSYPVNAHMSNSLLNINRAMCDESNMVGHLVIPKGGMEIKSDFAGSKGNLAWFNTGNLDLMLRVEMNNNRKSVLLKPHF